MSLRYPAFLSGRRAFVGGVLAWLLSAQRPVSAQRPSAQGSEKLDSAVLDRLIKRALAEPDITPLSSPAILGLGGESKLSTRSIERKTPDEKYGFMVIIPRRENGLVFFRGTDKPLFFAVHVTGTHMNRVSSALNRDGKLVKWSGADADADFARQTAYWAKEQ